MTNLDYHTSCKIKNLSKVPQELGIDFEIERYIYRSQSCMLLNNYCCVLFQLKLRFSLFPRQILKLPMLTGFGCLQLLLYASNPILKEFLQLRWGKKIKSCSFKQWFKIWKSTFQHVVGLISHGARMCQVFFS